jgi:CRP-like cAMP-binding protein
MDLLERARCLMACPLFENLAPAVLVRLAERSHADSLVAGERRSTVDTVWIVGRGAFAAGTTDVGAGHAIGLIRVVRPQTPAIDIVAREAGELIALDVDDVRDVLEEDPVALAAIADRLAALLLESAP